MAAFYKSLARMQERSYRHVFVRAGHNDSAVSFGLVRRLFAELTRPASPPAGEDSDPRAQLARLVELWRPALSAASIRKNVAILAGVLGLPSPASLAMSLDAAALGESGRWDEDCISPSVLKRR